MTFAESTQRTYQSHRQAYLAFCSYMGYSPVPASTGILCRYAAVLARTHKYSSIKQYINIIRHLHLEWDLPNPLQNNYHLDAVLKGIRRALGDGVARKEPITPDILLDILSYLDLNSPDHANVWAASLCMFFGMLRRSNVLSTSKTSFESSRHLRRKDISFAGDGIIISIRWSKTIQYHQRILQLPLPRLPGHPLCPLQAVFHAFRLTSFADPDGPAFVSPNSECNQPLTVDKFLVIIRRAITASGRISERYAGHSFRRGGASWAHHSGVPIDTIRQIGDWKSNAYTKYIYETPDSLSNHMSRVGSNIQANVQISN